MDFTTGKKVLNQWSTKVTVEFIELPADKEMAYQAAIEYFAQILFQELTAPELELEAVNEQGSSGVLHT